MSDDNTELDTKRQLMQALRQLNLEVIANIGEAEGKKGKYQIHKEVASHVIDQIQEKYGEDKQIKVLVAMLYYNLGILGSDNESLRLAVKLLYESGANPILAMRWNLQMAAISSSYNQHQKAYKIACKVQGQIVAALSLLIDRTSPELCQFISNILFISEEPEKDDYIFLNPDRNIVNQIITKASRMLEKQEIQTSYPFFSNFIFQISEYMTVEPCESVETTMQNIQPDVRHLVAMFCMCYFTRATQKYYMQDVSEKGCHIKALRLALLSFSHQGPFCLFLFKTLLQHYGKKLPQINEQKQENIDWHDLRRAVPRDGRQVKLKKLMLADE